MDAGQRAALARYLSQPPKGVAAPLWAHGTGRLAAQEPPVAAEQLLLLMSIKPCYAQLIEVGFKRVEFRRRVPAGVGTGTRVIFYVSAPVQAIRLRARVAAVCRAAPAGLWRKVGQLSGGPRRDFDAYFAGAAEGVGLVLERVEVIEPAVRLREVRVRGFAPPQSCRLVGAGRGGSGR